MRRRKADQQAEANDIDVLSGTEAGSEIDTSSPAPKHDEPGNPDAWLQYGLVIGLLVLFLICAVLILVAWGNR